MTEQSPVNTNSGTGVRNLPVTWRLARHTQYLVQEFENVTRKLSSSWLIASGLLVAVAGCGSSNIELAPVQGQVLFNGQPLAGAIVEFQPVGKSPSVGTTDIDGQFQLQFSKDRWGAHVGEHVVKIDHDIDGRHRSKSIVPVPARYNSKSELKREVVSGSNSFDFDLKSDVRTASSR
jgi:hypothetical protein